MIETPAAACWPTRSRRDADFLSIGTNDLAQYTLAMDRGHAELAARIDGVHPAVLRAHRRHATARRSRTASRSRCAVASLPIPAAVPLLLGLGVHRAVGGAGADSAAQGD